MKPQKFWKLARPDGWDFFTGKTINYRDAIGHEVICPKFDASGKLCSDAFLHASRKIHNCFVGANIPCSVYRVSGIPIIEDTQKCGFEKLVICSEIRPEQAFAWNYLEAIDPINPFKITSPTITKHHIALVKKWDIVWDSVRASVGASVRDSVWASVGASVWDSVWASVGDSVWASVRDSVRASVRDSVGASVWDSVWASVWDSVRDSVRDSVGAYIGSLFPLKRNKWKYTKKIKSKGYPFQPAVDLWKQGLVPSFDGKIWRLHGGPKATVLWEER
jgi:hypothetical protein